MIFTPTRLPGAMIIDLDRREDDRGFFARTYCAREFEQQGLLARVAQSSVSFSKRKGTLRGMHYQAPPFAEAKLVRVTQGALHDVIVDLRRESPTYLQWIAVELTAENRRMLFIPEGFAHGFLTLSDDVEVAYQLSEFYTPEAQRGARHDDPAFGIQWPGRVEVISERDRSWPPHKA